eukprot:scaffold78289_cov69-Phaeocystis_antarctica.AAC.2
MAAGAHLRRDRARTRATAQRGCVIAQELAQYPVVVAFGVDLQVHDGRRRVSEQRARSHRPHGGLRDERLERGMPNSLVGLAAVQSLFSSKCWTAIRRANSSLSVLRSRRVSTPSGPCNGSSSHVIVSSRVDWASRTTRFARYTRLRDAPDTNVRFYYYLHVAVARAEVLRTEEPLA